MPDTVIEGQRRHPPPTRAILLGSWRVVRLVLIAYLVVLLVISLSQTQLIFPGQSSRGRPESRIDPPAGAELVRLTTADGDRCVALFGPALGPDGRPAPDAAARPTFLYFYGNDSNIGDSLDLVEDFRRLGVNVLVPEYVGYGMSEGSAGEPGCYATAEAAYRHLLGRPDVDPRRILAVGWSLGGAVAIDLAAKHEVSGLIVLSTFTGMGEMAAIRYPFLPTSWLLRHRFESERKIRGVRVPTLIVHGSRDDLIPPAMADRLASASGGRATRLDIPSAGHNDIFEAGGPRLFGAFRAFLDAVP